MMFMYTILYSLFVIFYLPGLIFKRKFHKDIFMRFGLFPKDIKARLNGRRHIWLHAVSLGEAMAVSRLAKQINNEFADIHLVISTVTTTGNKIAKSFAREKDTVIYLPLEFNFIIKKVIDMVNPEAFITVETELWPKLINNLSLRKIPIIVVNGRISEKSLRGYKFIKIFMRRLLANIDLFCMQTQKDAERIIQLGAPIKRIKVTGNMKFDMEIPALKYKLSDLALSENDMLLIAGSTHHNEEEIIIRIYRELMKDFKNLKLLIAARHVERTGQIEKVIKEYGLKPVRISELKNAAIDETKDIVYLADTIGELKALYSLATLVFMGGSLIKKGGQNPIEPAVFAKPIIFGEHMHNFQDIAELFVNSQAAIQVKDEAQLRKEITRLLSNPIDITLCGKRAKDIVEANRGAVQATFNLLKKFLN